MELALASIPGFATSAPPGEATPTIVYWPTLVASQHIVQRVVVGPEVTAVAHDMGVPLSPRSELPTEPHRDDFMTIAHDVAPLGAIYGARSGDKGGNANVGIWAKTPGAYNYLSHFLTIDRFKLLYPDLAPYPIERYAFSNLRALNFVIRGLLGDGVSSSTRIDPQAKTLGEYIRARIIEIPKAIRND